MEIAKKEHVRNVKTYANSSNLASHSWKNGHKINFEGGEIIDKGNYRVRKTLESWHTETTKDADNNSKPLRQANNTSSLQRNAAFANYFALFFPYL